MMKLVRRMWRLLLRLLHVKHVKHRTTSYGDSLTKWEEQTLRKGTCPDCEVGSFLQGPCGGISMNVKCDYCGSKFNYHVVCSTDRISEPCPERPELLRDETTCLGVYR